MRILIWSSIFSIGGGSRLLANLATAIARQDDIELVRIVVPPQTEFGNKIDSSLYPNIEIVYLEGDIRHFIYHPIVESCHVVYYFWPHGPEFVDVNKPSVITFHDAIILDYVPQFVTGEYIRDYWIKSKSWLENSTKVIVSSQYVKTRLISHFGTICNSAAVIPHAISPAKYFGDTAVTPELAAKLPKRYIIYPANTSPHKNHFNLFLAYAKFSRKEQIPLVLFGYLTELLRNEPPMWPDHPSLPTLVSLLKRIELGIDKDVYPLGLVKDQEVSPLINNAYALIMPSLAEGGGSYPVEEALSMGVPVLCSDIPVMREHLSRRSAKVAWFRPESPDSIGNALEHLVANYNEYKKSAVQGMDDPTGTWDEIAKQYISAFRSAYLDYWK